MNEIEELKRRKMEELQSQMQGQMQEEAQLQAQIQQLEEIVKANMTKEAIERYGNVKMAHPEKAVQVLVVLVQMLQRGGIEEVNDSVLKQVLEKLTPQKREFKIKRR